jgi:Divergent InlB B-repeat domain/Domain of unknown function DUF11
MSVKTSQAHSEQSMSTPRFNHLLRWIFLLFLGLTSSLAQAQITNGGFETTPYVAPTIPGWTKTFWQNKSGLIVPPSGPFTGASIQREPVTSNDLTNVVTGGDDANTIAGHLLSRVRFGSQAVVVNYMGKNYNANTLTQTITLDDTFKDTDDKYHIRFAYAPVLQSGGHSAKDQPFFYVGVTDTTTNGILYDSVNYSAQSGITWYVNNGIYWTDWQVVDIVLDSTSYKTHQVKLEFTAAGCDQSGHWGHLYVDGVAPKIQDLWITGNGPATVTAGSNITYNYTIRNDSLATTYNNVTISLTPPTDNQGTPVSTTFVSSNLPGLPAGAGTYRTANIGSLAAGASASYWMTVNVPSAPVAAAGTIIHGDYYVSATGYSAIGGPAIRTVVSGANTDLGATVVATAGAYCNQISYLVTVTNNGPVTAASATASFALPAGSTFVSAAGPIGVLVTGSGPVLAQFGDMANGASKTFTVVVSMPADTLVDASIIASATASGAFTNTNVDHGAFTIGFTWPAALSISTHPASGSYFNDGITVGTLTVAASAGWGTKSYQWYSGASGTTTTPVGTNSTSFTVPTVSDGNYSYWVRVTDACGSVDSTAAAILVYSTHNITASAGANGGLSPAGVTAVTHGNNQSYTITPNTGYHVLDLLVDGVSAGAVTSYTFTNVTTTHTIAASFAINTYNITASAGTNGSISPTGATAVNHGSNLTYTLTPGSGYHVSDLLVDGASVGAVTSYTFTNVTTTHTIAVSFAINTYNITASAGTNGSISPTGITAVNHGSNLTYTLTPGTGYHVADLLVDGVSAGAVTSYTFTNVTTTHTIAASFAINVYNLTYTAGANGTLTGTATQAVNHGASGSAVTAVPNTGYHFTTWSDGVTTASRTDAAVTGAITVTASFVINTYTLTYTAGANGTLTGTATQAVNHGASGTAVTAVPNTGYHFATWSDGVTTASRTDAAVTGAISVTASFVINTYTLTYTAGANGTLTGTATQAVNHGASGSAVTAVPNLGYHFIAWSDGLATASRTDVAVTGAITVTASFAINSYTLTYTAGANGTLTGTATQAVSHGASGSAVTAVPNLGYHFIAWSDGLATASRTDVAVTAAISVTASFAINTFTIQASVVGSGQAYPTGTQVVAFDSNSTFIFTPGAGKRVGNVLVDGVSLGPVLTYTFTSVRANHVISVVFDEVGRFTVVGNPTPLGSIAPGQTFANAGDCQSVYITPDRGFHVTDVQINGISVGAVTEYRIASVKENIIVTATFAADDFKVTTTVIGNGEISPALIQGISSGADLTIHFLPADGCVVQDVQLDGRSIGAVSSYTFRNVQADYTVVVRFTSR